MIFNKFSEKQREILDFSSSDDKYLISHGAVRSGKTSVMILSFVLWAMNNFNNQSFAICGKTVQGAKRNLINPLLSIEGLLYIFNMDYKISENKLIITSGTVENTFYVFGGKDERSYALIQGITLSGVLLDEVALMPQSFVEQAIARTLTFKDAKIWFNCNPESPNHWFFKDWIKSPKEKTKILHFLMEDNPIMEEDEIKEAKSLFQGVFYNRYILGQWIAAEGVIYSLFADNRDRYIVDKLPESRLNINIGLDFGGNNSKHALCASGIDDRTNTLYVLETKTIEAKGVTPQELYMIVDEFTNLILRKYGNVNTIYADSAEQTLISGLRTRVRIPVRNSIKNKIIDRIRCATTLMSLDKLFLLKDKCVDLEKSFCEAVWNAKKDNDERLDDGSYCVDILDAFEYSFEREINSLIRG